MTKSMPDRVLIAKALLGEFREVEPTCQYRYAEIEFPAPQGWELRPIVGNSSVGLVGYVEGHRIILSLKRRHPKDKNKKRRK